MREWRDDHPKAKILGRKRNDILEAATRLFVERGYADSSMETVAQEAGAGIMTVYRHFASKDDLFTAVILKTYQGGVDADGWSDEPPEIGIPHLARSFLSKVLDPAQIGLYRGIVRDARRFPELAKQYYAAHATRRYDTLARYLSEQHAAGVLDVPRPAWSAALFASMLKTEVFEMLLFGVREEVPAKEQREIVARCSEAFIRMHRPQTSPTVEASEHR